jgi:pimeloyl-ACP methyl ester carboxylesterase
MQQRVSFYSGDHLLAADLSLPDGLAPGETRPGIVLCNGYTATKELFLPETAAVLAGAGYAVLSFDYTGWGESEGSRHCLAPSGRVMDAHAAVTFLGLQSAVDHTWVGVLGWSYGGATAIWLAAIDERLGCTVSIGGVGDGTRWMRSVRDADEWASLLARSTSDRSRRVLDGRSGLALRTEILKLDPESVKFLARARQAKKGAADEIPLAFVDETITFNPEWVVGRISPHAVLLVTGENDLIVPPAEAEALFAHAGEPKKLSVIEGAGHYDLYTGQAFDEVMGEAVARFGDHLGQA